MFIADYKSAGVYSTSGNQLEIYLDVFVDTLLYLLVCCMSSTACLVCY